MITERDVEWTCRECLDFENCMLKHIRDDKTCRSFHPDQWYIDCELRRLNEIEREKNQLEKAKELGAVKAAIADKTIVKEIYVKGKIINIVVK